MQQVGQGCHNTGYCWQGVLMAGRQDSLRISEEKALRHGQLPHLPKTNCLSLIVCITATATVVIVFPPFCYPTDSSEVIGGSSVLHNTLTIQNTVTDPTLSAPPYLQPDNAMLFSLGSQEAEGYANGGDPNTTMADSASYTAVHSVSCL